MFKIAKDNRNIFQICINLNDNVDSLKESRRKLLDLNPDYDFHYITSQEEFEEFMQTHFKNSEDAFEQKIYEVFSCIPNKLRFKAEGNFDEDIERCKKARDVRVLVSRTDVFRYAALYKFGGFYLDLSSKAEIDINQELEKYDCVFLRSVVEVHSSICYAKKHSYIIKNILENITSRCLSKSSIHQMSDVGPGVVTNTVVNIVDDVPFKEFKKYEQPAIVDKLAKINEFSLKKHNSVVFLGRTVPHKFKIQADWKHLLHTPDPARPDLIPNRHWLGWF
jgi:hypothetical protein